PAVVPCPCAGREPHLVRCGLAVEDEARPVLEPERHEAVARQDVDLLQVAQPAGDPLEARVGRPAVRLLVHRWHSSSASRALLSLRATMIEWDEQHLMIRDMMRRFIDEEIKPNLEALEHGDLPPYEILRKLMRTFGMDEMARQRFASQIAREKAAAETKGRGEGARSRPRSSGSDGEGIGLQMVPIIELCRWCPGMVTAMGVSFGLTAAAIMSKGTIAQKERWALPLLTMEAIGAWAITEPGSGSDAFGGMKSSARRDGDDYVLNGSKTFITNGPFADTIVFICK